MGVEFVSCLCWNAGQTHIWVLVLRPLLLTAAAAGEGLGLHIFVKIFKS